MKLAAILFIVVVAMCAALLHSRRHYFGPEMEAPLYRSLPDFDREALTKPNAMRYLLAMNRRSAGAKLTLHGLWPEWAQDCSEAPKFDVNSLAPIRGEMDEYWESYNNPNPVFWQHEWDKHLSCEWSYRNRNSTQSQLQTFSKTLDLLHQYTASCDNVKMTDCRCILDMNFKLTAPCKQK